MSDDKLSFLDETPDAPSAEPAQAEPVAAAPEPEQADDRPRDPETGRFVPISALLDERDKRQAETRRREVAEEQLQRYQQPEYEPTPQDNPNEWAQALELRMQQVAFDTKLNTSELHARKEYGDQAVSEAQQAYKDAMQSDPNLMGRLHQELHPYEFVVKWHKQQRLMSEIGTDPEGWRKSEAERIRAEVLAELQGQGVSPRPSSQQPPPSMVGRPAAARAGTIPSGPGHAFDNIFKG